MSSLSQDRIPSSSFYRMSLMHRDTLTHLLVVRKLDFLFTASVDGHVKLWKINGFHQRNERDLRDPLEFVKDFHAHLGAVSVLCQNRGSRSLVASASSADRSFKVFDVVSFDMICMAKLTFCPGSMEFVDAESSNVADSKTALIQVFDATDFSSAGPLRNMPHRDPVIVMRSHPRLNLFVSTDSVGMIEFSYAGLRVQEGFEPGMAVGKELVKFESKFETDMFVLCENQTIALDVEISEENLVVVLARNRKIFVFELCSFKLVREFDQSRNGVESAKWWVSSESGKMNDMDIGKRLAIEDDIDSDSQHKHSVHFDPTDPNRVLVGSPCGIQVLEISSGQTRDLAIGQMENIRCLVFDIWPETGQPAQFVSVEAAARSNFGGQKSPTAIVFTSAYRSNRFYVLEGRFDDPEVQKFPENDERDLLNERPYHDALAIGESKPRPSGAKSNLNRIGGIRASNAVIHTSLGDIAVLLYPDQCPKTVENFCGLATQNYFNGHLFHRVIRQFMIQTGDPLGTGVGGQSIWGHEFQDEFHPSLKHDKPYTLSMANAGPNTNASQFFITVVPCPWLDNKHTLFGRVTAGMDVVHRINNLKVDKNDKPEIDVKITSVSLTKKL